MDEHASINTPKASNGTASNYSISESSESDNPSNENFALREETEDDLTRQHLENMEPTDSMSDSEKWLLDKYQRTQAELAEKETQIAEQERLATSAGKHSQPR